jgi:hypothetical protein
MKRVWFRIGVPLAFVAAAIAVRSASVVGSPRQSAAGATAGSSRQSTAGATADQSSARSTVPAGGHA